MKNMTNNEHMRNACHFWVLFNELFNVQWMSNPQNCSYTSKTDKLTHDVFFVARNNFLFGIFPRDFSQQISKLSLSKLTRSRVDRNNILTLDPSTEYQEQELTEKIFNLNTTINRSISMAAWGICLWIDINVINSNQVFFCL